jgi:FixJ family two-component response regulator
MTAAPRRVFVVDDEEPVRRSLRLLLEAEGLTVQVFASARAALAALDRQQPACILVDYHMPDMGGSELVEEMRRRDPGVPVVVMTGSDDPAQLRLDPRVQVIRKPFDARSVARLLRTLAGGETD